MSFKDFIKRETKVIKADLYSLLHDHKRQKFIIMEGIFWIIALIIAGIGFFGGLRLLGYLGGHITKIVKHILSKL